MISLTLNGEPHRVPPGHTLADLVHALNASPESLATAINGDFVPRAQRATRVLQQGDAVFTFQPITGG